jgi:hypothetical protein
MSTDDQERDVPITGYTDAELEATRPPLPAPPHPAGWDKVDTSTEDDLAAEVDVPPGMFELTDEEIAQLPILDPEILAAAAAIDSDELPAKPFHDPQAMDLKAEVTVHDGMGPFHLHEALAEATEGDFDIEWLRIIPIGMQCRVTNRVTHDQRTVNLNEHALMILMAETGIAAITQTAEDKETREIATQSEEPPAHPDIETHSTVTGSTRDVEGPPREGIWRED